MTYTEFVGKECEGGCEEHVGTVNQVTVTGNGFKGGFTFNYCEEAIAEDRRRGFTVEIVNPDLEPVTPQ